VSLFWLTYRHPDGRAARAVVVESHGLLQARLKAALAGAFNSCQGTSSTRTARGGSSANMIGRLLDDGDLRKLHRMLLKKKPPA
jgi:hypothetical protein